MSLERLWAAQRLMLSLAEHEADASDDSRRLLGEAARNLLDKALDQPGAERVAEFATEVVRRTFDTDPVGSETQLRKLLSPDRLAASGHWQLLRLVDDLAVLVPVAPNFVADVFDAVFSYAEQSTAATPVGGSQILPLRSTRRQDYELARGILTEAFGPLLETVPPRAVDVLDGALSSMLEARYSDRAPTKAVRFMLHGHRCAMREDASHIWDDRAGHEDGEKLLAAFDARLHELAEADKSAELEALTRAVFSGTRNAAVWAAVLRAAAQSPTPSIVAAVLPLLLKPRAYSPLDLQYPMSLAAVAVHGVSQPNTRAALEAAIMLIPRHYEQGLRDYGEQTRDRVLASLGAEKLATEGAQRRLGVLLALQEPLDRPRPPFAFEIGWEGPVTDEHLLRDQGVDTRSTENAALLAVAHSLEAFANAHRNQVPEGADRTQGHRLLRATWEALSSQPEGDQAAIEVAWGHMAEVAYTLARRPSKLTTRTAPLVVDVLLACAQHPKPAYRRDELEQFDKHPYCGAGSPRIEAAQGLTELCQDKRWASQTVRGVVLSLSRDKVPSVRYAVARRAAVLLVNAPDLAWQIVEERVAKDPSASVVRALLEAGGPFFYLSNQDQARALRALARMVKRERRRDMPREKLLRTALQFMSSLAVWRDAPLGQKAVGELLQDPAAHEPELEAVILNLRDALVYGEADDEDAAAVRRRALAIYGAVLDWTVGLMGSLEASLGPDQALWPEPSREAWTLAARLADSLGNQLYFASGVFQERQGRSADDRSADAAGRARLFEEAFGLLACLSELGLPQLAHRLIELAAACADFDPPAAFRLLTSSIRAGSRYGYQYESMAVRQATELLSRYLATYRGLFEDEQMARDLLDVLEVFVSAGWPEAWRLVYGLDEVYR